MSYQRYNHPLDWFDGFSKSYVYHNGEGIVDYGDEYNDTVSLIDLIGDIIERETGDKQYATKIVRVLAKKMGVENNLRPVPLIDLPLDEHYETMRKLMKEKWG